MTSPGTKSGYACDGCARWASYSRCTYRASTRIIRTRPGFARSLDRSLQTFLTDNRLPAGLCPRHAGPWAGLMSQLNGVAPSVSRDAGHLMA